MDVPKVNQPTIVFIPAGTQKPMPRPGGGGSCQITIHSENENPGHIKLFNPQGLHTGYHYIEYTYGDTTFDMEINVEAICIYNDAPENYSQIEVSAELL